MSINFNWGYSKKPLLSNVNIKNLQNQVNQNSNNIAQNTNNINDIQQEQIIQNNNIAQNTNNINDIQQEQIIQNNNIANLQQNKQDKILYDEYKLKSIYNRVESIFCPCRAGSGIPDSYATGVRFNTIHTNLRAKPNVIYTIKTTGSVGNNSERMWYSACQVGCYVSNGEIVVYVNKLYDNDWNGDLYQDNIYIQEWRIKYG